MSDERLASKVMSSWIGALTQSGVLLSEAEAGRSMAAYFIGPDALERLQAHFQSAPAEVVQRERRAAIEACIWMACADRKVTVEERALVQDILASSGLPQEDRAALAAGLEDPPSIADIEKRLESQELRELLLALAWELAMADGELHRAEQAFLDGLVRRFGVAPMRAAEIVTAVQAALEG